MHTILWRALFVLAGILILLGGPQHPGGTIAEMLADSRWLPSHALMLAAFVSLLGGLVIYASHVALSIRARKWLKLAVLGTVLQSVEMAFHTAASVDLVNLPRGTSNADTHHASVDDPDFLSSVRHYDQRIHRDGRTGTRVGLTLD